MNNLKFLKISLLIVFSVLIFLSFSACKNKKNSEGKQTSLVSEEASFIGQKWEETDKRVALVLGLGYTESQFIDALLAVLGEEFGLDAENGLIYPILFPEDFVFNGVKGRISSLPDILLEKNIDALFIIGAPEGTHRVLASIQDRKEAEKALDFPVFSLFPQDDVLGIESGSDIVIDFGQFYSPSTAREEGGLEHLALVPEVLRALIAKRGQFQTNFSSEEKKQFIKKSLGFSWDVETSVDVQTGLKSKNHFEILLVDEYSDIVSVVDSLSVVENIENKK